MVDRKVMFVDSMGADEHYRGQGIGRELFAFARNICEEQDYDGLELQVNAKNIAAKRMYEKYGFYVIDRQRAPWGADESIFCRQMNVQENPC